MAGPASLAAGRAVDVRDPQTVYWSRPLVTDGGFTKTGDGTLTVAGRTTATGDVLVREGALAVDGTLTLGTRLDVAPGATLAGFGTIRGDTTVNGVLGAGQLPNYADLIANNGGTLPAGIPLVGTSPGTLTFDGDVALSATATTRVDLDGALQVPGGPGTYDRLVVDGTGHVFVAGGVLTPVLRDIPGGNNTISPPAARSATREAGSRVPRSRPRPTPTRPRSTRPGRRAGWSSTAGWPPALPTRPRPAPSFFRTNPPRSRAGPRAGACSRPAMPATASTCPAPR